MKTVVVYPGRFQPMLPHHAAVYSGLQTKYPNAEVYIATSDKVEHPKSPFNFAEKKAIMSELHNIPADRIINVRRPYNGDDYACLLYTSPSPRDQRGSRMPSSA